MSNKDLILLALKDEADIDVFKEFVAEKGYESISTTDGAKAMELALINKPSLIVVDLELPVISGERLFQILTHNPNTSKVPFMLLSDTVKDIKGFRVNVDTFITKPFKWDELYGSIKQTLMFAGKGFDASGDKDIAGRLSHMPLVDILQVLHFNKKEGELVITHEDQTGMVLIKDGQVYNAVLGQAEKEKALFRLFTWKDGAFEFHPRSVASPLKIETSTGNLLMEGMRQIDEFEKAKPLFPDNDSVLKPKVDTSKLPKGLKPIIYEILFLIDYYPKVENLVDHCSFTDYDVYRTLISLINRNIIEEVKAKKDEEGGESAEEFVTPTQAIKIKEKIVNRWGDMLIENYGKVFVISTRPELSRQFVLSCKSIPDFVLDSKLVNPDGEGNEVINLGQMGTLKLYGSLDIVFFSIPTADNMGPLINALSSHLVGLILLWDDSTVEWGSFLDGLAHTKKTILSQRRVPIIHVYTGDAPPPENLSNEYKSTLKLGTGERILVFDPAKKEVAPRIIRSFFDDFVKDDYIASKVPRRI